MYVFTKRWVVVVGRGCWLWLPAVPASFSLPGLRVLRPGSINIIKVPGAGGDVIKVHKKHAIFFEVLRRGPSQKLNRKMF
jgi:hypothetical protein